MENIGNRYFIITLETDVVVKSDVSMLCASAYEPVQGHGIKLLTRIGGHLFGESIELNLGWVWLLRLLRHRRNPPSFSTDFHFGFPYQALYTQPPLLALAATMNLLF